jgi:uncharacterized protein
MKAPVNPTLLIVGASTRAAAQSAIRAGFQPWCADLFADSDLRAIVPDARRCPAERYPNGLVDLIRDAPDAPWIYTGGLENHPRLIATMMQLRRLWGNGPDVLRLSRNPFLVEDGLRKARFPAPRVIAGSELPPADCRWLRKPLRGSAGQGIAFADEDVHRRSRTHYFQQFIDGIPMSAVFVRAERAVTLLGITEQLVGLEWLNAPPFRYCGSVGPLNPAPLRGDLLRIATVLGDRFGLKGLFGVDFVLRGGRPWVVEVNPRYPASVEILELATGMAAIAWHRAAFDPGTRIVPTADHSRGCTAKAIVYAPYRLVMPDLGKSWSREIENLDPRLLPGGPAIVLADIPAAGDVVEHGWPILTILAAASTREVCLMLLKDVVRKLLDSMVAI